MVKPDSIPLPNEYVRALFGFRVDRFDPLRIVRMYLLTVPNLRLSLFRDRQANEFHQFHSVNVAAGLRHA